MSLLLALPFALAAALVPSRPSAPALPPAAVADSVRSDAEIRQTALRNARDVRGCYEREGLRRNSKLNGTVEVELTILPTGVVEHAKVATSTLAGSGASEVADCITTTVRHWSFERGPYRVEIVVYPFHFTPASAVTSSARWSSSTD